MNLKLHHARFLFTELQRPLNLHEPHDELSDFDTRFRLILRKHLVVLCWWSILNIVGGVFAVCCLDGVYYYFWMMGLVWGLINFAITMAIFNHTFYKKFNRGNSFERFEAQRHVEKIMFLNIGIDTAYIFAGLLLREHSFVSGVCSCRSLARIRVVCYGAGRFPAHSGCTGVPAAPAQFSQGATISGTFTR